MKLKALNTFYVQNEKRVVSVGDEFETTASHGNDLIKNGMAEFIAESELDNNQESSNEDVTELKAKIADLEGVVAEKDTKIASLESNMAASSSEKDQKIADLEAKLNDANEQLTALSNNKDVADKPDDKGKNKK